MAETEKVTAEAANQALEQLLAEKQESAPEAPTEETPAESETEPVETEKEEPGTEVHEDDLESLKTRLSQYEAKEKESEAATKARLEAMQGRFSQNEKILRERYVRKSTVTDKLLKALEQAKTETGLDPAEVDRLIAEARSTMNPASASYAEPRVDVANEDHAIILNGFYNEQAMTDAEVQEFGRWMQSDASSALSPVEVAVAQRDLDGFLRIAHRRFLDGKSEAHKAKQRTDAVEAVRSVQRTQREAAKAATSVTSAPKKQPAGANEVDTKKLTPNDIGALLRQTVEQYH